jgi:hypothetical protein
MSQQILKAAAGLAALAAIAFGASAIASGSNDRSTASGPAAAFGGVPGGPPGAQNRMPPAGPNGAAPPGAGPGMGQPVTGAIAAKVKAAALARYPGTIERIDEIPGLGYVAHVFRPGGGEVHVLVTKQFQVKGLAPGPHHGPPGAGLPPAATPPSGGDSRSAGPTSSGSSS